MSIKNKPEPTKTNCTRVIFNDGPSGFELGFKLDMIVDFVKANESFLWRVKWEGDHPLGWVTQEEMKLIGRKKAILYLENCLKNGNYEGGWLHHVLILHIPSN